MGVLTIYPSSFFFLDFAFCREVELASGLHEALECTVLFVIFVWIGFFFSPWIRWGFWADSLAQRAGKLARGQGERVCRLKL